MRTTGINVVQVMAAALMLTQICLAQKIEQPNAIGDDTLIEPSSAIDPGQPGAIKPSPARGGQTNAPFVAPGQVRTSGGGNNDSWRMVNHNGTWWYYHPNGNWSNGDGTRWNPYTGLSVAGRHNGDVEVSGAELGMGVGASRNSGLSNRPGAVINGKGGIGGTKAGAGLPGTGTGVRLPPSGNITSPN